MSDFWRCRNIAFAEKTEVYIRRVGPSALYGAPTWTWTRETMGLLWLIKNVDVGVRGGRSPQTRRDLLAAPAEWQRNWAGRSSADAASGICPAHFLAKALTTVDGS